MIDQNKYIHFIEMYRKAYPDLQKEKGYRHAAIQTQAWLKIQTWGGNVVKKEKRSGTLGKDYHWIKRESYEVS